jgi:hypothetical protein
MGYLLRPLKSHNLIADLYRVDSLQGTVTHNYTLTLGHAILITHVILPVVWIGTVTELVLVT